MVAMEIDVTEVFSVTSQQTCIVKVSSTKLQYFVTENVLWYCSLPWEYFLVVL